MTGLSILVLATSLLPSQIPSRDALTVGWNDEFDGLVKWEALKVENKAFVASLEKGTVHLWLEHVPSDWPYAFQWSGQQKHVHVQTGLYPVLMAHVTQVQGYAHLDLDVLDSQNKVLNTVRSNTLNGPGLLVMDLSKEKLFSSNQFSLRMIVGGDNTGCSATYDWVRFVAKKDVDFVTAHPDFNNVRPPGHGSWR